MALAGQYSIEERDQHVAVGRDVFHTTIQFEARSVLTKAHKKEHCYDLRCLLIGKFFFSANE